MIHPTGAELNILGIYPRIKYYDPMFLTKKECEDHIERNGYNYSEPHSYAMTAFRSPQVEKLYDVLQNTDWESLLKAVATNE